MKFLKSKIALQLLFWLLIIEFPVECLLVYISYRNSENTLRTELTEKLEAIATFQMSEINQYVSEQLKNATTLSEIPEIIKFSQELIANSNQKVNTNIQKDSTKITLSQNNLDLIKYKEVFGFESLLLIAPNGNVVVSTENKIRVGENITQGEWKNTELNRCFSRANTILQTDFSDFDYLHKTNKLSAFVAAPIRNTGKMVGVLMVGIDFTKLTKDLQNYTGMGKTGENLLVTKVDDKLMFVVPTRYQDLNEPLKTLSVSEVNDKKGEGIRRAVNGQTGSGIVHDYAGKEVFAHWHYIPALRSGLVVKEEVAEAFAPIKELRNILIFVVIIALLLFVIAAFNVAQMFSRPIRQLNDITKKIANGDLSQKIEIKSNNEIGELAHSFNDMTHKLDLSQKELINANLVLEMKVAERTEELHTLVEELSQTNEELHSTVDFVEQQKVDLVKKNENIVASITYARRIQAAILPLHEEIGKVLKDFFIYYKPRDIVSGDFYWFANLGNNKCLMVAADCTGHGVPGALMSMIGVNLLNEIVYLRDIYSPDKILTQINIEINRVLQQSITENRDGMDIAICLIDFDNKVAEYSGAMNPLYYVQNDQLHEIKATRMGIGGIQLRHDLQFELHTIDISKPTMLYLASDGYADQIGGKEDKKFMSRKFKELLFSIHHLYPEMQKENLNLTLLEWIGLKPQIDDIMVIGIKV